MSPTFAIRCGRMIAAFALGSICSLPLVMTHAADVEGSADHPLIKRYDGAEIAVYSQQAFAEYPIALGKALNAAVSDGKKIEKETVLRGQVSRMSYVVPMGRSALEVFENYTEELKAQGFEILWSAKAPDTGYEFGQRYGGVGGQLFEYSSQAAHYLAARQIRPEGEVAVAVFVTQYYDGYTPKVEVKKGQTIVQVDVVDARPREQRMVTQTAAELSSGLNVKGRVTLHGVFFDTNRTEVKPESKPALDEVAKLMTQDPTLKVLVVGHTDTVGGFEPNRSLSERRAAAVVQELKARYGITGERLFSFGVSYAAPAATNSTEEGRAQNRRVELVKM
ncbi:OmpA family protein [Verrucomicrobium sp. BvORR106]|uniref:OmpA family protein n=1 Tax=Verrucomicrobium sp. BvORR106 TaxID=1403819 RepID=UPI0005706F47|nr:OmpA family protein [Verrucomicrobium sp. BvORR106]